MKHLFFILTTLVLFSACKKVEKEESPYFFNGNWSCDFNACQAVSDSSISIFSHVTDLSISYDQENYGLMNWNGCVNGNGQFEANQITDNKFEIKFTQTPGNIVYVPNVDYSINWNSFVPNGSANYNLLNSAVITVEKISENSILFTIAIDGYPIQTYQWIRS